jgi:hypothetical protein
VSAPCGWSGRGGCHALRSVWSASRADVLAYMDVDLSTDLNALVAPLLSGHSDLAIGTRLARGARVVRGPRREVISRCYNVLAWLSWRAVRTDRMRARDGACRLAAQPPSAPRGVPGPSGPGVSPEGGVSPQASTASALLWGGWLVVTGAVFSFMAGSVAVTRRLRPARHAMVPPMRDCSQRSM